MNKLYFLKQNILNEVNKTYNDDNRDILERDAQVYLAKLEAQYPYGADTEDCVTIQVAGLSVGRLKTYILDHISLNRDDGNTILPVFNLFGYELTWDSTSYTLNTFPLAVTYTQGESDQLTVNAIKNGGYVNYTGKACGTIYLYAYYPEIPK